jgi:hypothetical protein
MWIVCWEQTGEPLPKGDHFSPEIASLHRGRFLLMKRVRERNRPLHTAPPRVSKTN